MMQNPKIITCNLSVNELNNNLMKFWQLEATERTLKHQKNVHAKSFRRTYKREMNSRFIIIYLTDQERYS